jgi:hypothetical protein
MFWFSATNITRYRHRDHIYDKLFIKFAFSQLGKRYISRGSIQFHLASFEFAMSNLHTRDSFEIEVDIVAS